MRRQGKTKGKIIRLRILRFLLVPRADNFRRKTYRAGSRLAVSREGREQLPDRQLVPDRQPVSDRQLVNPSHPVPADKRQLTEASTMSPTQRLLRTTLQLLGYGDGATSDPSNAAACSSPSAQMVAMCWFLLQRLDPNKAREVGRVVTGEWRRCSVHACMSSCHLIISIIFHSYPLACTTLRACHTAPGPVLPARNSRAASRVPTTCHLLV